MTCSKCVFWCCNTEEKDFGECSVGRGKYSFDAKIYVMTFDPIDDYALMTHCNFFCAEYKEASVVE